MAALPYMQFHIAEYLADTQHLDGAQHGAYMLLMWNYWTRGKALVDNDERLAVIARTDLKEWREHVRPIVEEFFTVADGEWRHGRIERDLGLVTAKCEQAKTARSQRKSYGRSTPVATDVTTDVPTGVTTPVPTDGLRREEKRRDKKEQKPSRAAGDERHVPFRSACEAYAKFKGVPFAWDGAEAKQLAALLAASPDLTLPTFQQCLTYRARSDVAHGDRPRTWLGTILKFHDGPLDGYGKPKGAGNGTFAGKTESSLSAAQRAIDSFAARARAVGESGEDHPPPGEVGSAATSEADGRRLLSAGGGPGEVRLA